MSGKNGWTTVLLPGAAAALALGLIAIPLLAPNASEPTEIQESAEVTAAPTPTSDDTATSASPSGSATPIPSSSESSTPTQDPEAVLNSALAAYNDQILAAGGVRGSFISADSQEMTIYLKANGDFRAVTTNPDAPEWMYVDPVLYARLGDSELAAQKKALAAIGKPDATWTDAATTSDQQGMYLSAGDIANAVADLLPLTSRLRVTEGPEGSTVIQGVIDLTGDLGLNAQAYNLRPADASVSSDVPTQAAVVFTIDASGVLQGYLVQPPGSEQPVSLLLTEFFEPTFKRPEAARVITIEDLAPIVDDSTSQAPTPAPAPSAS